MSDYSLQVTWSTKDALAANQQLKAISATELGNEFSAIAVAVATKYDSDDLASQAEARALTEPAKLLTPDTLDDVLTNNDSILKDLYSITGTAADGVLAWDQTDTTVKMFTMGTGMQFNGTTLEVTANLQAINALAVTDSNIIVGNGSTWVAESGATARTSLGLGSLATASSINGDNWSGTDLAVVDGGTGASTATAAATNLGLGTGNSPQFAAVNLSSATATTLTGSSGQVLVEGKGMFQHNGAYTSGEVFFSTSAPTTEGDNGDIYFEYTA